MPPDKKKRADAANTMMYLLAGSSVARIIYTAAELGLADDLGDAGAMPPRSQARRYPCAILAGLLARPCRRRGCARDRRSSLTLTPLGATLRLAGRVRCERGRASLSASMLTGHGGPWITQSAPARMCSNASLERISGPSDRPIQITNLFDEAMQSLTLAVNQRWSRIMRSLDLAGRATWGAAMVRCCCWCWNHQPCVARSTNCLTLPRQAPSIYRRPDSHHAVR